MGKAILSTGGYMRCKGSADSLCCGKLRMWIKNLRLLNQLFDYWKKKITASKKNKSFARSKTIFWFMKFISRKVYVIFGYAVWGVFLGKGRSMLGLEETNVVRGRNYRCWKVIQLPSCWYQERAEETSYTNDLMSMSQEQIIYAIKKKQNKKALLIFRVMLKMIMCYYYDVGNCKLIFTWWTTIYA